ncbi:hypothetical protein KCU67_g12942, partial [Aureobasidium melanogenum]
STYPTGKDEYYTSCAEIDIVDSVSNASPVHTLQQQDPQTTAVSSFKSRTVLTSSPLYTLAGASGSATSTGAASSATTTSSSGSSSISSSAVPSNLSTAPSSESTSLPIISLPPFPFANTSSPTPGPTYNASGNPSFPFYSPPSAQLPSFVTVTDYITMSGVANKAQGSAPTQTTTEFVTSYVTASASTVLVATAAQGSLPSVVAVPDQAGNAGLIGRRFVA